MFVQSSGRGGVVVSNFGLCPNFIIFLLGVATEGIFLLKNPFFFVINIVLYIFFYFFIPPVITGSRFSLNQRLGGFSLLVAMFDSSVVRDQNWRLLVRECIDKISEVRTPFFWWFRIFLDFETSVVFCVSFFSKPAYCA